MAAPCSPTARAATARSRAARSRAARIRHDYNYAQVLTLSLWGAGIEPVEVPISYRRRDGGRSFVRYPEYFGARGAGALAPVPRLEEGEGRQRARRARRSSAYGQAESSKNGNSAGERPERGVGPRRRPARRRPASTSR